MKNLSGSDSGARRRGEDPGVSSHNEDEGIRHEEPEGGVSEEGGRGDVEEGDVEEGQRDDEDGDGELLGLQRKGSILCAWLRHGRSDQALGARKEGELNLYLLLACWDFMIH